MKALGMGTRGGGGTAVNDDEIRIKKRLRSKGEGG